MTPSIFNDDVDIGFLEQFVNMPDSELEQLNFTSFPFPDLDFPLQADDIPDFSVGMDNQLGMTVNNEPRSVLDFETSRDGMNSAARRARTKGCCRPRAIDQNHCERWKLTFPNEVHQVQNKTPDCVPLLLEPERKCTHCETTKMPQWRTGPKGRKTLCNACGVRYKSGRLCPEYRPASSPTFSPTKHSNSHEDSCDEKECWNEFGKSPCSGVPNTIWFQFVVGMMFLTCCWFISNSFKNFVSSILLLISYVELALSQIEDQTVSSLLKQLVKLALRR